jgi:hypothetical protein
MAGRMHEGRGSNWGRSLRSQIATARGRVENGIYEQEATAVGNRGIKSQTDM